MKILVLGGDGYCGWATALHLSASGHDVGIVDSFVRRQWDADLGVESLTPIRPMEERVAAWRRISGKSIDVAELDLSADADHLDAVIAQQPNAVVHFAEQRSAPFSMMSQAHAVMTQMSNVAGTLNLLYSLKRHAPDCHLVKLGTMGEYGTPNIPIEEGWLKITHKGRTARMLYPKSPGSWYHASKVHDSTNIEMACRIWGLRATDLNQGVVYGTLTPEVETHQALINRFDYDEVFGTVLNRFCAQAAVGYPLTVYGTGGQTRGFLDIRDTVRCIELACVNPADPGQFRVFNQFTEQFSVQALAELVQRVGNEMGLHVTIDPIDNPRVEAADHFYQAAHTELVSLGLKPHLLSASLAQSLIQVAISYRDRIDPQLFAPRVDWRDAGRLEVPV